MNDDQWSSMRPHMPLQPRVGRKRWYTMIPEGRALIDTAKSSVYIEGGLKGVLMDSRLSGLSPNLTSRFTTGALISSYEVYEALRRACRAIQETGCRKASGISRS